MASEKLESGVYFIKNVADGTVLNLNEGSAADGTKVQGFAKRELNDDGVLAQLWIITSVENSDAYIIQNPRSRTYLTLKDGRSANATPIIGNQRIDSGSQRWKFVRNPKKEAYTITNEASSTSVVDLYGGGKADGTAVNGWYNGGFDNNNQQWELVRV